MPDEREPILLPVGTTLPDIPEYDESKFWSTIRKTAAVIGAATLTPAFTLYQVLKDERTPTWARTIVAGSLAYLVFPADAIPDILPFVGYSDDLGAIAAASAMVVAHIKKEHREKAAQQVKELLG